MRRHVSCRRKCPQTRIWPILDGTINIGAACMAKHPRTWLVRAGKNARFIDDFRANSHVAIGWRETGPIPPSVSDDALADLIARFPRPSQAAGGYGKRKSACS
jgi:hypothetical protein